MELLISVFTARDESDLIEQNKWNIPREKVVLVCFNNNVSICQNWHGTREVRAC